MKNTLISTLKQEINTNFLSSAKTSTINLNNLIFEHAALEDPNDLKKEIIASQGKILAHLSASRQLENDELMLFAITNYPDSISYLSPAFLCTYADSILDILTCEMLNAMPRRAFLADERYTLSYFTMKLTNLSSLGDSFLIEHIDTLKSFVLENSIALATLSQQVQLQLICEIKEIVRKDPKRICLVCDHIIFTHPEIVTNALEKSSLVAFSLPVNFFNRYPHLLLKLPKSTLESIVKHGLLSKDNDTYLPSISNKKLLVQLISKTPYALAFASPYLILTLKAEYVKTVIKCDNNIIKYMPKEATLFNRALKA